MSQYKLHPIVKILVGRYKIKVPLKSKATKNAERFRSLLNERAEASFKSYDFINKKNFFYEYALNITLNKKISIINSSIPYILSELDKVSTEKVNEIISMAVDRRFEIKTRPCWICSNER